MRADPAAKQAIQRLPNGLPAEIPKRHVDPRIGKAGGSFSKAPQTSVPQRRANPLALPWTVPQHERLHGLQRFQHRRQISSATAFAPTDQAVICRGFDDDVGYAGTINLRTFFRVGVVNVYREEL